MRKSILTFFLFISSFSLFSQQDAVLKNFKFRNVNYRAITFSANGGASYANGEYALGNATSHSSSGTAGIDYQLLKSTDNILLSASASFSFSGSFNKSTAIPGYTKNKGFYFWPSFYVNNKWFVKKLFIELGAGARYITNSSKSDFQNAFLTTSKGKEHVYTLAPTIGIGRGRLENIRDMQNALWLAKTLEKEGRLSHSISANELNELGNTVVRANNKRVLDSRKQIQFVLETVDDYFQQKGLVNKTDIKYFSNLNDILFFAVNNPRLSGTEMFIRFTPAINHSYTEQSQSQPLTKSEDDYTTRSAIVTLGVNRYKPINLYHQNNYGLSLLLRSASFHRINKFFNPTFSSLLDIKTPVRQVGLNLFFEHAIYPNTRTTINFDLRSEGGYQEVNNDSNWFAYTDLDVSVSYFISYRTRFTASIGTYWQRNMFFDQGYQFTSQPDDLRLFANAGIQVNL